MFVVAARFLSPLFLLISVLLLMRGHNEPGGGFAGGLVAAAALAMQMMAFGKQEMLRALRVDPRALAGFGLVVSLFSAFLSLLAGKPFFTGLWWVWESPLGIAKLGTPMLFDLGVYFVVIGISVSLIDDLEGE